MADIKLLTIGYPGFDHIMRVTHSPSVGETGIIVDPPGIMKSTPGGCVNNIAVAAARLGIGASPVILVGDDLDGKRMREELALEGVDTSCVILVENCKTSQTFLFIEPNGGHQTFYFPGAADEDIPISIPDHLLDHLDFGVITVGNPFHTRFFINQLNRLEIPLVWSLRNDSHAFPEDLVHELISTCKIIVMNEFEAQTLLENLHLIDFEALFSHRVETVIVTKGSKGSRIIQHNKVLDVPPVKPQAIVDPTGAGDAFLGGLLVGLCLKASVYEAACIGATASSFVLEAWGTQTSLPDWSALSKRFQETFNREPEIRRM